MELGKYKKEKLDFKKYIVTRPKLTFFPKAYSIFGCGPSAAATLTSVRPEKISAINKDKNHFSDKMMYSFLSSKGIQVIPVTVADVSSSFYVENNLTKEHLLLLSQMYSKNQASWTLVLNMYYIIHNFEISPIYADEFINRPILTAAILYKKGWK